jgi:hydroxymethylpyrimidine/phosphomethylpyrimidine kinase
VITLLSIAGFDPSGDAGILADLETFARLGARGQAVITAVTGQDRHRVRAVLPLRPGWLRDQWLPLLTEGTPAAVKIGMLGTAAVAAEVVRLLDRLPAIPVVLDPVLRATSGGALLDAAGVRAMVRHLLPRVTLLKPNLAEAERLLARRIRGGAELRSAAEELRALGPRAVVITGGDGRGAPVDVLADGLGTRLISGTRIPVQARGTGCRFTSAAAVYLARGWDVRRAVMAARAFVRAYLRRAL